MSFEQVQNGFSEATPTQQGLFVAHVNELSPLLNHHSIQSDVMENPFAGLPIGESVVGLSEDEPVEGETPAIVGHLAVTNLGGLIEIGEGLTIPSDPTRVTNVTYKGAFAVDDKVVVVEKEKVTQQNLRFAEDVTVSDFTRIRVISRVEAKDFSFWLEQLYDYGADEASFHELLYRKPKDGSAEWVMLAAPSWQHILDGTEKTAEEKAASKDQSKENPNRFDQNRYANVMELLSKVDLSNRIDEIPSLGQSSFKII